VPRRWVINGRFLSQPLTGVQRYAAEIVRSLDGLVARGSPLTRGLSLEILVPPDATTDLGLLAIPTRVAGHHGGHAWEQLTLSREGKNGLLSFCNTAPLSVTRQILCMHDTNTFNAPRSYSRAFRSAYRVAMPLLGRRAERIATVSAYSARELVRHRITDGDRLFLAPNGHEHALAWNFDRTDRIRSAVGPGTVVLVGSHAPHKNTGIILDLAPRLAAAGMSVAVVGMASSPVFRTEKPGASSAGNVTWLGRVSDGEMAALLQDSLCLAFPTLEEGLGLPPLEARALGCPVVASDRASLPEICGDAAMLVSPTDADSWLDALVALRDSASLRQRLVVAGRRRAENFRWEASALRYLEVMADMDGIASHATPTGRAFAPLN
jgi:glycosyltransferase involved in cell wall biosynthesis